MSPRRDPSPPINPPEPDHRHEDHRWEEPAASSNGRTLSLDGPGRPAAESLPFTPGDVVHVSLDCVRDGCDASCEERHFTDQAEMQQCEECGCERMFEGSARLVDHTSDGYVIEKSCPKPSCGNTVQVTTKQSTVDKDGFACTGAPPR